MPAKACQVANSLHIINVAICGWHFHTNTQLYHITFTPGPQSCASPVVGWPGWKEAHLCCEFCLKSITVETLSGTGWPLEAPFKAENKSKFKYKTELHSLHRNQKIPTWQHPKIHHQHPTPLVVPLLQGSKGSHMADRMAATNAASVLLRMTAKWISHDGATDW